MSELNRHRTAAVVGATGYTGAEIIRLLAAHPSLSVRVATSSREAGRPLRDLCPWLDADLELTPFDPDHLEADVVFLCQEAGFAMTHAPRLAERMRVVDLSADFRLADVELYAATYGRPHAAPCIRPWPLYGLPELTETGYADARIVANPGCYPTATLLALVPLQRAGLIAGVPVVDAKSGVSGAGRSRQETDYLFTELAGGFRAYAPVGHRHTPEISTHLGCPVRFTPHLIPAPRGICATIHVPVGPDVTRETLLDNWRAAYAGRPFVTVQSEGWPSTKAVQGSNRCVLAADVDRATGYAVLVSVIDNLVKGAAGQAIQNANLMFGWPEETGLPLNGVWP